MTLNQKECRKLLVDKLSKLMPTRKHGFLFENFIIEQFESCSDFLTLCDTHWAYSLMINDPKVALEDSGLSIVDDAFGDFDVMLNGKVLAQLSLKSVRDGKTLTIADSHILAFGENTDKRWFCYAVVDSMGIPTGIVSFVPAADFISTWKKYSERISDVPFIRLKYLSRIQTRIIGTDNFISNILL